MLGPWAEAAERRMSDITGTESIPRGCLGTEKSVVRKGKEKEHGPKRRLRGRQGLTHQSLMDHHVNLD